MICNDENPMIFSIKSTNGGTVYAKELKFSLQKRLITRAIIITLKKSIEKA